MELAKRMQKKDRSHKLSNNDTSADNQKCVNTVSSLMNVKKSQRLRPYCKLL